MYTISNDVQKQIVALIKNMEEYQLLQDILGSELIDPVANVKAAITSMESNLKALKFIEIMMDYEKWAGESQTPVCRQP